MEWQVKIEGHPKQRILVNFDPQGELIIFKGQYSIKNKWIDFSNESHSIEIDLEIIRSAIERVYVAMNKRLEVYVDLNKTFGVIKEIKIMGEELMTIIVDNSVYGSSVDNTITDNEWNAPPK